MGALQSGDFNFQTLLEESLCFLVSPCLPPYPTFFLFFFFQFTRTVSVLHPVSILRQDIFFTVTWFFYLSQTIPLFVYIYIIPNESHFQSGVAITTPFREKPPFQLKAGERTRIPCRSRVSRDLLHTMNRRRLEMAYVTANRSRRK